MSSIEVTPQARLHRVLHAAQVIVWEFDLDTGYFHHETPVQVFGLREPTAPMRLHQALHLVCPQDRQEVIARARAAVEHRTPYVQHFRMSFAAAGRAVRLPLWIEHHGQVLCDAQGRARLLTGTMIDITAHKLALDALAVADQRKDDFLATLAHELRNPLTAIGAASQLLKSASLSSDQAGNCVSMIHRQCEQLRRLVDDLLDVSHVVRNRLELKRERVDLCEVLRTTVESIAEPLRRHRHRLDMRLPEQMMLLDADPVRLGQLFANLLGNAIKYTPDGGRIEVSAECNRDWVVVKISDSGLGIPSEHLLHVFEPFYQVDSSLAHSQGGLGIGLALVRRIAQLHGGSVSVYSGGLGQGSEFSLRLPLLSQDRSGAGSKAAPSAAPARAARPLRVLVADDDADVAQTLSLSLQTCGHQVRVALDGEEALKLADQFRPQAALLDVGMPKRAGHEVARELRTRSWVRERGIVLVALTGWNARDLCEKLDMSAFDSQMTKPTDIDAVRQLIEGSR